MASVLNGAILSSVLFCSVETTTSKVILKKKKWYQYHSLDRIYFLDTKVNNFSLFNFLFCIGVEPVNNTVIVSGEQGRDSAVHIHVSILPQTPLLSRLPHNTEFPVPQAFGL